MSTITRRQLLHVMGLGATGALLAACQPQVVKETVVVNQEATQIVKETVVVPQEVTKVVKEEVTQVVKETVVTVPTSAPLEITIMKYVWGTPPPKDSPMQQWIEDRIGAKLRMIWVPYADLRSRINVGMASDDLPDIYANPGTAGTLFNGQEVKSIELGMIKDLTPYLSGAEFATNLPNLSKYADSTWMSTTYRKKNYIVPMFVGQRTIIGTYLRRDLYKKAGYKYPDPMPQTVDDVTEIILKLNDPGKVFGFDFTGSDMDGAISTKGIATGFTGLFDWGFNDQGNFVYQRFVPQYQDFLKWFKKLYDAGAVNPEFMLGQNGEDYSNGKAGLGIHVWNRFVAGQNWEEMNNPLRLGCFSKEAPPDADSCQINPYKGPVADVVDVSSGFWTFWMMNSRVTDDRVLPVLKVLDWFASPESYDMSTHGLKDVHYTEKDGKKVTNDKYNEDSVGTWNFVMNWETFPYEWHMKNIMYEDQGNLLDEDKKVLYQSIAKLKELGAKYQPTAMPAWNLYSKTLFDEWGPLTVNLSDNRVKVVTGKMSMSEWETYINGITSSDSYKKIVDELKADYEASK